MGIQNPVTRLYRIFQLGCINGRVRHCKQRHENEVD